MKQTQRLFASIVICVILTSHALVGASQENGSNRRMKPTFIVTHGETVVASAVATAEPYNADASGKRDASAAIQKALDAVAAADGGVVFLPAGRYRLEAGLRVGYGTVLRGEWQPPGKPGAFAGTVLLAYTGRGNESGAPLIALPPHQETGLIGVTIYYPEQRPDDILPYPFAIAGGSAAIRYVTLCNAYNGIELALANACVVEGIRGTVLRRGMTALNSLEFGWSRDIRFSNEIWPRAQKALTGTAMTGSRRKAVDAFTRSNLVGIELGRLDAFVIDGFKVEAARLPVLIHKRPHVEQHRVFGFGGLMHGVARPREEHDWDPWYYGMHYADLDTVPEAAGRSYTFGPAPIPARTGSDSFFDVTAAPFEAVGDGKADDTQAISAALEAAGRAGGGTVYLPQGEFKVTRPLKVPSGVELRGPLGKGKIRENRKTCSLAGYVGRNTPNPETATPLITLMPNSGVRGFTIVFSEQSVDVESFVPFPYAVRGTGAGVWIVDMHLPNAAYGIDLATHRCDNHLVRDLWGTALLKGIQVGGGSRNGRLERVAFSWGPWAAEANLLSGDITKEAQERLAQFHYENSVHYTFGDCIGQKTWGLVGFYPRNHFHFVAENGNACRDAEFWMTMHDVARETCLKLDAGERIDLMGYFGTGGRDKTHNWFETGPGFQGPLNVCGAAIHQQCINHPITAAPEVVRFFNERSLTDGRDAKASATAQGSDPRHAVDRDPRTWWEAPAGSLLDVDLGESFLLSRVRVESAGPFSELALNTVAAELLTSEDGSDYAVAARLTAHPGGKLQTFTYSWIDVPILPPVTAGHVRLRVTGPGADAVIRVAGFDVWGTRQAAPDFKPIAPRKEGSRE